MYMMYVDESGDTGLGNSPTRYFVLSGVIIHELQWRIVLDRIVDFRRRMKNKFTLKLREEIHAAHMLNSPGELVRIPRNDRLTILRHFADEIASLPSISIINIVVDKRGKPSNYDVFENAWRALIQRFENTIVHHNFPGPRNADDKGMIFPDATDVKKLTRLIRRMRQYNPVPNHHGLGYRNLQLTQVIEDPIFKNSELSYLIQVADLSAFLLYQKLSPSAYMRKKGASNYFSRLDNVLCKVAGANCQWASGIVWL